MCSVCGQYPCSAQCPNADEQPVLYCSVCNSPIYHDYDYFEVCGVIYCEDCIHDCRRTADKEITYNGAPRIAYGGNDWEAF